MSTKKNETERILRVDYTDAQRLELGKDLATAHNDLTQTNSDFDRVKAEFKSKISAHESKIVDLSNKVSTGYHMVATKCLWRMDEPKKGMKVLVRLDKTPNEIIDSEEMTEADKQQDLPIQA